MDQVKFWDGKSEVTEGVILRDGLVSIKVTHVHNVPEGVIIIGHTIGPLGGQTVSVRAPRPHPLTLDSDTLAEALNCDSDLVDLQLRNLLWSFDQL